MDLTDQVIIQVDVPTATDALAELSRGCNLVVSAFDLDDMKGFEFALRVKQTSPDTAVIILGDLDDPEELDEQTAADSPFVYLSRPVDAHKFLRVLQGGLDSPAAMMVALNPPPAQMAAEVVQDMGPVPPLDAARAQTVVDALLRELSAMAIVIASREGEVLLERGAVGYVNREQLIRTLLPMVSTNLGVKEVVGGNVSSLQFYDGDEYDMFVLSVGLHHLMCIMFDGVIGSRKFGPVNTYGRRAVEDLIVIIGPGAFFIQPPKPREEVKSRQTAKQLKQVEQDEPIVLAPAEIPSAPEPEPEPAVRLDPISDFDLDKLFGASVNVAADELFDPDKLEEMTKQSTLQGKTLSWDDAERMGLLGKK
jgi:CheY-like chemotaxis protein